MKKRRHHHVWQHYLKPWASDGSVFCLSDGRIFPTGTTVVAVERDFYKLHDLSDAEARYALELTSHGIHPVARQTNKQFLERVLALPRFVRDNADKLNVPNLDTLMDDYKSNVVEDYHAGIEADFIPFLERMQQGDVEFFADDSGAIDLINFICLQYLRTKPIKDRTVAVIKEKVGIDLTKSWDLIAIMLANNAGGNLYAERKSRKLVCLENNTGAEFVTSDQPVFNLHVATGEADEKLTHYYPVSPTRAVILTEQNEVLPYSSATLTPADVNALNRIVVEASHRQVFAHLEASLAPYSKTL